MKKKNNKKIKFKLGNNLALWVLIILGSFFVAQLLPNSLSNVQVDYNEYRELHRKIFGMSQHGGRGSDAGGRYEMKMSSRRFREPADPQLVCCFHQSWPAGFSQFW